MVIRRKSAKSKHFWLGPEALDALARLIAAHPTRGWLEIPVTETDLVNRALVEMADRLTAAKPRRTKRAKKASGS